jgi:hypothetical protein
MQVPLLAPYPILIVVTRPALLRLRLVFLYRTFIPMALALALHTPLLLSGLAAALFL